MDDYADGMRLKNNNDRVDDKSEEDRAQRVALLNS